MMLVSTIRSIWLRLLVFGADQLEILRKKLLVTGDVGKSITLLINILMFEVLVLVVGIPYYVISSYPSDVLMRHGISVARFRAYRLMLSVVALAILVGIFSHIFFSWWNFRQQGRTVVYTWSFADEEMVSALRFLPSEINVQNGVVSMLRSPTMHGTGEVCQSIFEMSKPFHFSKKDRLVKWSSVATAGNLVVSFQLSIDNGKTWYTWEKGMWRRVTSENALAFTSEKDVSTHLNSLPYTATGRDIIFRTRLLGNCNKPSSISSVSVAAQVSFFDSGVMPKSVDQGSVTDVAIVPTQSLAAAVSSFTVSDEIPVPENLRVMVNPKKRVLLVSGTALAGAEVFVYFDIPYQLIYRTRANNAGEWHVEHDQNFSLLSSGSHAVYARARDPQLSHISQSSEVISFVLNDRQLPMFLLSLDTFSVSIVLSLLVSGALVFVYLERKKIE